MKLPLLRSLEHVSSPVKAQMLLSVADKLADITSLFSWFPLADEDTHAFLSLVLGGLDSSAAELLNDRNGRAWEIYRRVLSRYFQSGESHRSSFLSDTKTI
jgi:hypothetical protein